MIHKFVCTLIVLPVCAASVIAQKLQVTIIDRQNNAGAYTYVVPGYSSTSATANCYGGSTYANCNGSSSTTTTPAIVGSYQVTGATLSLQLPDGRVAVINCNSKVNWTEWSMNPRRSCRIPLVNSIDAEFDGDKAKLSWVVSLDGKKRESETYKIIAVLDKPVSKGGQ